MAEAPLRPAANYRWLAGACEPFAFNPLIACWQCSSFALPLIGNLKQELCWNERVLHFPVLDSIELDCKTVVFAGWLPVDGARCLLWRWSLQCPADCFTVRPVPCNCASVRRLIAHLSLIAQKAELSVSCSGVGTDWGFNGALHSNGRNCDH